MAVSRTGRAPHQIHDIGPAAAYGGADNGRLAHLEVRTASDLVGKPVDATPAITRRRATPAELARLAEPVVAPMRPITVIRPAPRPAPSAIPAAVAAAPQHGVSTAASGNLAEPAEAPVVRHAQEEPVPVDATRKTAIPCGSCLHEPVCRLKDELPRDPEVLSQPHVIAPGLWLVFTGARVECDHYLGEAAMPAPIVDLTPEPIRREHGGESWRTQKAVREAKRQPGHHPAKPAEEREKAERLARVMAALERNGGDRKAAALELGMKVNALAMVVKFADRRAPVA